MGFLGCKASKETLNLEPGHLKPPSKLNLSIAVNSDVSVGVVNSPNVAAMTGNPLPHLYNVLAPNAEVLFGNEITLRRLKLSNAKVCARYRHAGF